MGSYIEVPANHGKAELIKLLYGGEILDSQPAWQSWPKDRALIVVVKNALFEAAGYAYSEREYEAFTQPDDLRPKQFVLMDRSLADALTGRDA